MRKLVTNNTAEARRLAKAIMQNCTDKTAIPIDTDMNTFKVTLTLTEAQYETYLRITGQS